MFAMSDLQARLDECGRGKRTEIARACQISPQAVYQWDEVPPAHVLTVERITGIPRSEIRPDIYPPEPVATSPREAA